MTRIFPSNYTSRELMSCLTNPLLYVFLQKKEEMKLFAKISRDPGRKQHQCAIIRTYGEKSVIWRAGNHRNK